MDRLMQLILLLITGLLALTFGTLFGWVSFLVGVGLVVKAVNYIQERMYRRRQLLDWHEYCDIEEGRRPCPIRGRAQWCETCQHWYWGHWCECCESDHWYGCPQYDWGYEEETAAEEKRLAELRNLHLELAQQELHDDHPDPPIRQGAFNDCSKKEGRAWERRAHKTRPLGEWFEIAPPINQAKAVYFKARAAYFKAKESGSPSALAKATAILNEAKESLRVDKANKS